MALSSPLDAKMAPDHGKVDRSKGTAMGLPLQGRLAFLDRWKGSAGAAWDPHHAPPSFEPKWQQKQHPYIWSWWLWWLLLLPPITYVLHMFAYGQHDV